MRAKAVNDRTKLLMFSFLWFRIDAYFHVIGIEIRPITSEFRNAFWLEGSKMCICAIYWWLFSENLTPQMKFYATSRAYSNRKHIQVTTKLFKKQRKVRVDNLIAFVWCGRAVHLLNGQKIYLHECVIITIEYFLSDYVLLRTVKQLSKKVCNFGGKVDI